MRLQRPGELQRPLGVGRGDDIEALFGEEPVGEFQESDVVVDDEQPLGMGMLGAADGDLLGLRAFAIRARRGGAVHDRFRRRPGDGRQPDREARAFAEFALDADAAAHQVAQVLAQRQAEAGAAVLGGDLGVGLREVREQRVDLVLGDADAGILDRDLDPVAVGERLATHLQRDLAVVRKLRRVADEVENGLAQLGRIEMGDAELVVAAFDDECVGVLGRQRT